MTGRRLELTTSMGQSLDCELCCSAIDARGREFFTCVPLVLPSQESECQEPKRFIPKRRIELIPCDPLVGLPQWEHVMSPRFVEHLNRALGVGPVRGGPAISEARKQ